MLCVQTVLYRVGRSDNMKLVGKKLKNHQFCITISQSGWISTIFLIYRSFLSSSKVLARHLNIEKSQGLRSKEGAG